MTFNEFRLKYHNRDIGLFRAVATALQDYRTVRVFPPHINDAPAQYQEILREIDEAAISPKVRLITNFALKKGRDFALRITKWKQESWRNPKPRSDIEAVLIFYYFSFVFKNESGALDNTFARQIERDLYEDGYVARKREMANLPSKLASKTDNHIWHMQSVEEDVRLGDLCSFSLFDLAETQTGRTIDIFLEVSALPVPDENGNRYGFNKLVVRLSFDRRHKSLLNFNSFFKTPVKIADNCYAELLDSGQVRRMCLSADTGHLDGRFVFEELGYFFRIGPLEDVIDFSAQLTFNCMEESFVYRDGTPLPATNKARLMALVNFEQYSDTDNAFGWRVLCNQKYSVRPNKGDAVEAAHG